MAQELTLLFAAVPISSPGTVAAISNMSMNPMNLPLEKLKELLQHQLEYYFSRENLAHDAYLISQMDADQFVPIRTIANFVRIRKLTSDIDLVTQVLRGEDVFSVLRDFELSFFSPG